MGETLKAHTRDCKRHWAVLLQRAKDSANPVALTPKSGALKLTGSMMGGIFALVFCLVYSALVQPQHCTSGNAFNSVVSISPVGLSSLSAAPMRRLCMRRGLGLLFAQFLFAVVSTLSTNRLFVPRAPSLVSEGLNCLNWKLHPKWF